MNTKKGDSAELIVGLMTISLLLLLGTIGCNAPEEPVQETFMEGTITHIGDTDNYRNPGAAQLIIWFEEKDTETIYSLPIYFDGLCKIPADTLEDYLEDGDLLRVPKREQGSRYKTDEIQKIARFSEVPFSEIVDERSFQPRNARNVSHLAVSHSTSEFPSIRISEIPEYSVLTLDSKIFNLSLKNQKITIFGDLVEAEAHKKKFRLELEVLGRYLDEGGVDFEQVQRMLKNAGFVKVVDYKEKSIGDLMENKDI
jgi:hypothetical protein